MAKKQIPAKDFMLAIAAAAKSGRTLVDVAHSFGVEYSTVYQRWNTMRKEIVADWESKGRDTSKIPEIPTGNRRGRPTSDDKMDLAEDIFGSDLLDEVDTDEVIPSAPDSAYDAAETELTVSE